MKRKRFMHLISLILVGLMVISGFPMTIQAATTGGEEYIDTNSIPTKVWDQVFGGSGDDRFNSVIQTSDGGYVATGYSDSLATGEITDTNNGGSDGLLVKFDSDGNRVWNQVFGESDGDRFNSVIETSDGGYVAAGYTDASATGEITDTNNGGVDGLLVKFDSGGKLLWNRVFDGLGNDNFKSVIQTSDGGYVAVGYTWSSATGDVTDTNNGGVDGLLVKFAAKLHKPELTVDDSRSARIDTSQDLKTLFNVSATDSEDGDLTSSVTVDDSAVDYNNIAAMMSSSALPTAMAIWLALHQL